MSSKATATPKLLHKIGRAWSSPAPRPVFRPCNAVATSCCMRCQHLHSSSSKLSAQPVEEQSKPGGRKKVTIKTLQHRYMTATPITMLTAYDYSSARFLDRSGIDVCLVGDSLAMVACGYPDTTELGMDEMLYHCRAVSRGAKASLKIADMPFGSHQASIETGITNAIRLVKEGGMEGVKIEGGSDVMPIVTRLVDIGIPVVAHVGLMPQRQASLSGYRVQGKTAESALKVLSDAKALQQAGAFAVILEAIPAAVAARVTEALKIPTIGIGASAACSGQVLVTHDMLGMTDKVPRFCKTFGNIGPASIEAMQEYAKAVKDREFPQDVANTYDMPPEELQRFLELASDVKA